MKKYIAYLLICLNLMLIAVFSNAQAFDEIKALNNCVAKVSQSSQYLKSYDSLPRTIDSGKTHWSYKSYKDWTSGFWPGIVWYTYEYTNDKKWKLKADSFSNALKLVATNKAHSHDIGFQMTCSYGNGYRLTKNPAYKKIMLSAADSLATLFNDKVGTILSWPAQIKKKGWEHNTIIDNMMNLELLFWASKNGDNKKLYDIAIKHATITMQNHFRDDYSAYHVILYDTATGKKMKGVAAQGYADYSMWARGQAWAIYGFTVCYRETKQKAFLDLAQNLANIYLKNLPNDKIPYWDFNAPDIPYAPKDASAAAVAASALIELSGYVANKSIAAKYKTDAINMLATLSSPPYQNTSTDAILLHSTGHKPAGSEIDVPLIYADYYYMEALLRLKKMRSK